MHRWFYWFGQPGTFVLTMLLSGTALVLALIFPAPERLFCLAGMLCSTVGDLINTGWRGFGKKLPFPALYAGAGCFAAAHGFYITAFAGLVRRSGGAFVNPGFWVAVVAVLTAGILVSMLCFRRGGVNRVTYSVCIVYLCVIGCMLATVFSAAWCVGGTVWLAALGALSFFISDLLIGLNVLCGMRGRFVVGGVWWFYPIGQLLLLAFV